jgi:dTDP-4-amino-4,6-dideoxygalactose transaminase
MSAGDNAFAVAKEPVPSWADLFRVALTNGKTSESRFLFARGRQAIYFALAALGVPSGDAVLVPAYVCNSVTAPIRAYGAKVVFYRVDRNGVPDLIDAGARLDSSTRAMVAVHYFGFPTIIRECQAFCRRFNLQLIEDCAHVLQGDLEGSALGSFGDAAVFSWRKQLPLSNAGELVLRTPHTLPPMDWVPESTTETLREAWDVLDQKLRTVRSPIFRKVYSALRGVLRSGTPQTDEKVQAFESRQAGRPISHISKRLLLQTNLAGVAQRRRENYRYLLRKLQNVSGIRYFASSISDNECPLIFPLVFELDPNACRKLRKRGIPATTWADARPSELSLAAFPEAAFLFDHLVFLPIHQSLRQSDLDLVASEVSAVAKEQEAVQASDLTTTAAISMPLGEVQP